MTSQKKTNHQVACLSCDLLVEIPELSEGQKAACPRCRHQLAALPYGGILRPVALATTGLILLAIATAFPFLSFKSGGQEQVMTLGQTAFGLYEQGSPYLAFIVGAAIMAVPLAALVAVILIALPLALGKRPIGGRPIVQMLFAIGPWTMADVFMVGVLVSLTKIASMATVVVGISFWAYAAFAIVFIATMASLDRHMVWNLMERSAA